MFSINKIASDIVLFCTDEFKFFSLPDEFCSGSSIMPNKRNPDVLELLRGSYSILIGAPDDPITKSLNMSILSLLLTIVFVLSCIFYGIITLIKKSNNIKGV